MTSGIHSYIYLAFCCDRWKDFPETGECTDSRHGESPSVNDLLCSNPGIRRVVLQQRMEGRMERCQVSAPLCPSSRAICSLGRPLVCRNSQVVERVCPFLVRSLFPAHLHFFRKIFDSAPDMDEEPQEAEQDTQGPSTRSRMDTERLERIRAAAAA